MFGAHNTILLDSDENKLQLAMENSLIIDSFDRHDVWVDPELAAMGVKRRDQEHVLSSISEDLIKIVNSKFNNVPEFMMKEVSDVSSLPWFEHPGKIKLS